MFGFSKMGPIDIKCDSPSYKVVQACRRIGFDAPEDVRWCRLSDFLSHLFAWKGLFHSETWKRILRTSSREESACTCGQRLPRLDRVTFTFVTGREATYLLGQCRGCRTVFWDEP